MFLMDIIEQLNYIYYNFEPWHRTRLSPSDATLYHQTMLERGCLMPEVFEGEVVGYVEVWMLNWEQCGRLERGETFAAVEENTTLGNIAWVANLWVNPALRGGTVLKNLNRRFKAVTKGCEYIGGNYNKKAFKPFRIYQRNRQAIGV